MNRLDATSANAAPQPVGVTAVRAVEPCRVVPRGSAFAADVYSVGDVAQVRTDGAGQAHVFSVSRER